MYILVTGGAGFIGSHLVRHLLEKKNNVAVIDNLTTGLRENLPESENIDFLEADINSDKVAAYILSKKFDAMVHLAGQTRVDCSIDDPINDAQENILNTVKILELARKSNVARIVFASTAAAYGNVTEAELPIRESKPLAPMSFYGLSKVTVEKYLDMYQKVFGIDYVVLRFANVYGERQGDGGEGGVISIFAKKIAQNQDITIFGDGEQTRDFVYAGDVADGIIAALETENINNVYNISTQTEVSLRQLVAILGKIAQKKIIPKYASERVGDIYKSMLANERAHRGLGWKPKISIEEGLKRTYEHFLEQN